MHNRSIHSKDRGCTRPGCDVPGNKCGVHHIDECGWTTRKRKDGATEWIPPPHLDHGQPRINTFHHPEKLLCDDGEDEDERAA